MYITVKNKKLKNVEFQCKWETEYKLRCGKCRKGILMNFNRPLQNCLVCKSEICTVVKEDKWDISVLKKLQM
jgi:hypothetical protein